MGPVQGPVYKGYWGLKEGTLTTHMLNSRTPKATLPKDLGEAQHGPEEEEMRTSQIGLNPKPDTLNLNPTL